MREIYNKRCIKLSYNNNMERMISGVKPSGNLTVGNYIGAIKEFIKYQDNYD